MLYSYNKQQLQYKKIQIKHYIYSILIIGAIFSGFGFIFSTKTQYKYIKLASKPVLINKDSLEGYLFLTDLNYEDIVQLESGGNNLAVSEKLAIGSMQITNVALQDYNKFHKTEYTQEHLYISKINKKIGVWMLSQRIPYYLKEYNIPNTLTYKLIIYNWGIGNFVNWYKSGRNYDNLPTETKNYVFKYWEKY